MITNRVFLLLVLLLGNYSLIAAQNRPKARDLFDWKDYNTESSIPLNSVGIDVLQGNWISADKTIFGDYIVRVKGKDILEIEGDQYRTTVAGNFNTFRVNKNLVVFETGHTPDTAYINLINEMEMKISYKRDGDYVQYHYKK